MQLRSDNTTSPLAILLISVLSFLAIAAEALWQPHVRSSWQIELSSNVSPPYPKVDVFDLDLFDNSAAKISHLHDHGIKVICYFSAGTFETWRPDAGKFSKSDFGKGLPDWPGEFWLDTTSASVRKIMSSRLDLAVHKKCDGVDPDNTDAYDNDSGLDLTQKTAIDYMRFLATEARKRGLSIGLKNSGGIIPDVLDVMRWAVNEQCVEYDECDVSRPFIDAGKPVFNIEYPQGAPNIRQSVEQGICRDPQRSSFSTVLKEMRLNKWYYECGP